MKIIFAIAMALLTGLACSGCSQETGGLYKTSLLERNWGRSFETVKYNQILHPEADEDLSPVENIDGSFAARIYDTHRNGGTEAKKPSSQFGILTIKQ